MNLGSADSSTMKTEEGYTLEFAPAARTELLAEAHDITNSATDGDGFDIFDLADNLKMHVSFYI